MEVGGRRALQPEVWLSGWKANTDWSRPGPLGAFHHTCQPRPLFTLKVPLLSVTVPADRLI